MKKYIIIFILIFTSACSSNKGVYWCGDHPCLNKKEKEAYFRETMIVEIREFNKKEIKKDSEFEKLLNQAKLNEKERILTEKELIKKNRREKKELSKQLKLEKKRRIKEEKKLAKQLKLEEKKRIKDEKKIKKVLKLDKKKENNEKVLKIATKAGNLKIGTHKFEEIVNKILERNSARSYPDINAIPK